MEMRGVGEETRSRKCGARGLREPGKGHVTLIRG